MSGFALTKEAPQGWFATPAKNVCQTLGWVVRISPLFGCQGGGISALKAYVSAFPHILHGPPKTSRDCRLIFLFSLSFCLYVHVSAFAWVHPEKVCEQWGFSIECEKAPFLLFFLTYIPLLFFISSLAPSSQKNRMVRRRPWVVRWNKNFCQVKPTR